MDVLKHFWEKFRTWCHVRMRFDGTSDEKSLCFLCVHCCVEGAFGAASGDPPKMENGAPARDELKNGRGRLWVVPKIYTGLRVFFLRFYRLDKFFFTCLEGTDVEILRDFESLAERLEGVS